MAETVTRWHQIRIKGPLAIFVLLTGLVGVTGCATPGGSAGSGFSQEVITPSDEPEARRRARIRLELAVNYFEMGKATVALDEVKQSLVNDPTYADAYNLRGLIYMRLNDMAQAEDSFRRALSLRPLDPNVLHNHAWLLCQQQKYAEAEKQFALVLANPTYVARSKTLMAQGLCQARAGDNTVAEQTLLRAYELDAGNPMVGYTLADRGVRLDEAEKLIDKGLALTPEDPFILDSKGWLLYRRGALPAALELLRKAYNIRQDVEIAAHLGEVLWASGQHEDARQIWADALKIQPGNGLLKKTLQRFNTSDQGTAGEPAPETAPTSPPAK